MIFVKIQNQVRIRNESCQIRLLKYMLWFNLSRKEKGCQLFFTEKVICLQ